MQIQVRRYTTRNYIYMYIEMYIRYNILYYGVDSLNDYVFRARARDGSLFGQKNKNKLAKKNKNEKHTMKNTHVNRGGDFSTRPRTANVNNAFRKFA